MSHPKNRLRELRNSRNMSGVDVAEAINITPQYYYELEKGEKRLNEDLLRKLAEFFKCSIDYLLNHNNDRDQVHTQAAHGLEDAPLTEKDFDYIEKLLKKAREEFKRDKEL